MLTDFFRINMPYGIAKNDKDEWMAFNREYLPLGFNDDSIRIDLNSSSAYPIHTKYKGIRESTLLKLASDDDKSIRRDENGKINQVWFYDDRTNPLNDPKGWSAYIEKIKIVSKFKR